VERLALCSEVIGRRIESSTELTGRDVSAILAWLDDFQAGREAWQFDPDTGGGYVWPVDPPEEGPPL
jgi:hypothetical protein